MPQWRVGSKADGSRADVAIIRCQFPVPTGPGALPYTRSDSDAKWQQHSPPLRHLPVVPPSAPPRPLSPGPPLPRDTQPCARRPATAMPSWRQGRHLRRPMSAGAARGVGVHFPVVAAAPVASLRPAALRPWAVGLPPRVPLRAAAPHRTRQPKPFGGIAAALQPKFMAAESQDAGGGVP